MRPVRSAPAFCAALALAPLFLSVSPFQTGQAGQEGAPPEKRGSAYDYQKIREKENARITTELEGAWQLVRYEDPKLSLAPEDVRGYALFRQGYMALALQARRKSGALFGSVYDYPFQTTFQQFRVEGDSKLVTSTLIDLGDFNGAVDIEQPGTPHRLDVQVGDKGLVLTSRNGGRLVFQKLEANAPFPQKTQDKIDRGALNR